MSETRENGFRVSLEIDVLATDPRDAIGKTLAIIADEDELLTLTVDSYMDGMRQARYWMRREHRELKGWGTSR